MAENKLGVMPVSKLIWNMSLPIIASMLVQALYNIVDSVFVSWVSEASLTAVSLAFPAQNLMISLAAGTAVGVNALLGRALGAGERQRADREAVNGLFLAFVGFAVSCVLGLTCAGAFLRSQTQVEEIVVMGEQYLHIVMGCSFALFGQIMLERLLQGSGGSLRSMYTQGLGAIVKIILDPVFIFVCRWGMMGAAVATVLGQIVTAVLAIWYLCNMRVIRPGKGDFKLSGGLCRRILSLGMTSFLSQISLVAAMAAINNMLRKYGALDEIFSQEQYAQIPMAVVGIVMKFFQIVISIVVGMAAGCIPVVGFNMGAKKSARVKELFTKLLLAEAAVGVVALVLVEGFPRQLIALFGAANESVYYTDFAVKSFRIYLCMIILACVNKACFIFLQAMGKAAESTALSMVREVVFGVGFALLLPRFFGLDGVLYSMPLSDILTFLIAGYLICKTYRELNQKGEV